MKILIIRHGDPDYAIDGLTDKGKIEAELLANHLQNEKIDKNSSKKRKGDGEM